MNMNQNEDYIFTFVSVGETNGGSMMSRREFLAQHEDCWEELLRRGLSGYVCVRTGETLEADRAITRMMAYQASQTTRQHMQESLMEHYQLRHGTQPEVRKAMDSYFPSKVEARFQQMRAELKMRSERARRVA